MNTEYDVADLEKRAMEDESWEPDPQMRTLYVGVLHSLLIGA